MVVTKTSDARGGRRPVLSGGNAKPQATTRYLKTTMPAEPLSPDAHHLTSPASRGPLPRERDMVDPMRRPLDYILPLAEDDDLRDVLPRTRPHRSGRAHHDPSPLAAFEVLEAQLTDNTSIAADGTKKTRGGSNSSGGESSSSDDDVEGGDALLVLHELEAFGDRVAKVRCVATAVTASTVSTNGGMQPPPPSTDGRDWIHRQQHALLPEQEAAKLLSYSLSQPHMRALATAALLQQRKKPASSPPDPKKDVPMHTLSPTSPPPAGATSVLAPCAIDVASGISTMLTQQIADQQVVLQRLLTEHQRTQQAQLAEHRAEVVRAQGEASAKTDTYVQREVSALKRQQAELVRRVGAERAEADDGAASTTRIPLGGRHLRHGVVSGDITVHASNGGRREELASAGAEAAAAIAARNMPQETATLVANALQIERRKMEEERRQWQTALKQAQGDAAGHEKALLMQIKLLSERQEAITKATTAAALDKMRHANDRHSHQVGKLLETQQRQQIRVLREDVLRSGGGSNTAVGSQTHHHHRHGSAGSEPNAVAAELRGSIAQRKALTASKAVATSDDGIGAVVVSPDGASDGAATTTMAGGGASAPAVALQSTTTTTGGTESLLEGTSSLNHPRIAPMRRPKPGRVVLPPSATAYHLRRTEKTPGGVPTDGDDSDGGGPDVPRDSVRAFVGEAASALVDGGAVAGPLEPARAAAGSTARGLPVVVVLGDPRDARSNDEASDTTPPSAQCVEMGVSTLLSEQRTAELMGGAAVGQSTEARSREPPRYLNREEAQLLIDARKRLERIRQFSVVPSTLNDKDDPNVVHCMIGEPAETLLLNAVTSKLIHEVIAENVLGFLRQVEQQLPDDGEAATTTDVAHALGFGSTGSQALDRELLEECLRECINIVPTATRRYPQLGQRELQGRRGRDGPTEGGTHAVPVARQVALTEEVLWQEWVLARSVNAGSSGPLSSAAPQQHEHVRVADAAPSWLEPAPAESAATTATSAAPTYQPPAVHVHVDTSSLADLVRQLVMHREEVAPIANAAHAAPSPLGPIAILPATSRTLREESQRHEDSEELLPLPSTLTDVSQQQQQHQQPPPQGVVPSPYYCAPPAQLSFDDMEAMLADRILRRIGPMLFGAAPPPRPTDVSGVSSATTTDTSSSSSSSAGAHETPRVWLGSPELQALQSDEAVQRHRYCGDVDNVMRFVMRAFVEEAPTTARPVQPAPTATPIAPQQQPPQQGDSAAVVPATAAGGAAPAQPVPPPTPAIKDPVTNFLVDWFKHVDHERSRTQQPPTAGEAPRVATAADDRPKVNVSPPSSMISSTHPSSFGVDGMHRFLRYLPPDYVAGISGVRQPSAARQLRSADDTVTTVTTLYDTATSVTSSPASSRDVDMWRRPAGHRPHRGYDDADTSSSCTSSGTHTTNSTISSAEMQSIQAQRALQMALQWPSNTTTSQQQRQSQPYPAPIPAAQCS